MAAHALELCFDSPLASHTHCLWLPKPPATLPALPRREADRVWALPAHRFQQNIAHPGRGRFYPSRVLQGPGPWPGEVFRLIHLDATRLEADFNPPLALPARLTVGESLEAPALELAPEILFRWAGMEAPLPSGPTDFSEPDAFAREDEAPHALFYSRPRRVAHVDRACAARLAALYARILPAGSQVLDLMAGWASHVPAGHCRLTGLGMNEEEMMDNDRLTSYRVHDLNQAPGIPLPDASFDGVINSLSIEYLVHPGAVLAEVRRLLRPGGVCVIAFSHRYFPPKAIRLWTRLHPMERLGWVLKLLDDAGFVNLHSRVERGLARDRADRYAPTLPEMDPLFLAWGQKPHRNTLGLGGEAASP